MNEEVNVSQTNVPNDVTAENNEGNKVETKQEGKYFSEEEVNAIVEKRLKKEKAKQEKALKEAERLSKLSEDERAKAELESERAAFEEERSAYLKEKMLTACEKELVKESLPVEFAKLLVTADADSTSDNIKAFKEKWNKALESAVNERLKANSRIPKKETKQAEGITWEDVLKDASLLKKYKEQQARK